MSDLTDRLRDATKTIRLKSFPLSELIPLIQQSADALDAQAKEIEALRAEVERLNKCVQYEQHRADRIGTHGLECWKWGPTHYECAIAKVERLSKDAARYADLMQAVEWLIDDGHMNQEHLARIRASWEAAVAQDPRG